MNEHVRAFKSKAPQPETPQGLVSPTVAVSDALAPNSDPRATGKRLLRLALIVGVGFVLIAAVGYFGWNYWTIGRFQVSTDDAYLQADTTVISSKVSGYVR